jgi:hypothetical protein
MLWWTATFLLGLEKTKFDLGHFGFDVVHHFVPRAPRQRPLLLLSKAFLTSYWYDVKDALLSRSCWFL